MSADLAPYLDRIASQHRARPNFIASLSAVLQPLADVRDMLDTMRTLFDLDTAAGDQLDKIGLWIGLSRRVTIPIPGDWFSFDIDGLGFDQGSWFSTGDVTTAIFVLADDAYRLLLKARALNNSWDGSIPHAYDIWAQLFAEQPFQIMIIDNGDLTMSLGLIGGVPDAVTRALFIGGYLDIRPAGVGIASYLLPTAVGPPFALDAPPPVAFAGLDLGVWTDVITP